MPHRHPPKVPSLTLPTGLSELRYFVGGVDLEWNEVPGADSYGVQMYRNGQWTDLPGDSIEIAFYGAGAIISELEPEGSSYWFRVRAINAHGSSEWSDFQFHGPHQPIQVGKSGRPGLKTFRPAGSRSSMARRRSGRASPRIRRVFATGNSLDRVQFQFQWVSYDGNADTDIASATDSTYTPVAVDAGKTIKVRVAFTDRGGYAEDSDGQ